MGELYGGWPDALGPSGGGVPMVGVLGAGRPADLVDLEAREGVMLAIALLGAAVDIVVAKAAEEEIREGIAALAVGGAGRVAQPEGGVREWRGKAEVETGAQLRYGLAAGRIGAQHDIPGQALFVVDGTERAPHVGEVQPGLSGAQAGRCRGDVLRFGQRVELFVVGEIGLQLQFARLIVDQKRVVAYARRQALAAALGGPEEIVEIRAVPGQAGAPAHVTVLHVEVDTLPGGQGARRRVRGRDAKAGKAQRIFDVRVVADP